MIKDKPTLEALARVKRSEPLFVEWLSKRYTEHCANIARAENTGAQWLQGRMQEVTEIIDAMNKADRV